MTYLESCISCFSENSIFDASATCTPLLPYHVADTSHNPHICLQLFVVEHSTDVLHELADSTAALMRSCRLVLEMMILTLLEDADFVTTSIAACLTRMKGPSAPCLISSNQCQLAPSPRGSDVWALLMLGLSSALSINGVNCSHAVYSSIDPTSIIKCGGTTLQESR